MSLPDLPDRLKVTDGHGSETWWYDSARCMFVVGRWPIIENCWSEELTRKVAEEPEPSRRRAFAARLLELIPEAAV